MHSSHTKSHIGAALTDGDLCIVIAIVRIISIRQVCLDKSMGGGRTLRKPCLADISPLLSINQ